jgi:intraflagellar transport protein 172
MATKYQKFVQQNIYDFESNILRF